MKSVGLAWGVLVTATFAATNLAVACSAATLYLTDKGAKVNSTSIFGFIQYWSTKKL